MNKQIRPECRDDCFYPRTLDDAVRGAAYGSPIETPDGRKVGLRVGNVTYLRNDWFARMLRAIRRIIK